MAMFFFYCMLLLFTMNETGLNDEPSLDETNLLQCFTSIPTYLPTYVYFVLVFIVLLAKRKQKEKEEEEKKCTISLIKYEHALVTAFQCVIDSVLSIA